MKGPSWVPAGLVAIAAASAFAQSGATAGSSTPSAHVRAPDIAVGEGPRRVQDRIAASFAGFAGSEANARSLVAGLRYGTEVTLSAPGPNGGPGASTTFTPPTRPMGWGSVRIALALARERLAQSGIVQPTPGELQAALVGGTITTGSGPAAAPTQIRGVLQMRAEGMGWGRIANAMGVSLGQVVSATSRAGQPVAAPAGAPTSRSAGARTGTGVTTAAAVAPNAAYPARGGGEDAGPLAARRPGAGIVNAAGGFPVAPGSAGASRDASGQGVGLATAAGAQARAGVGGRSWAKGHGKH